MKVCICTDLWLKFRHGGVERVQKFARALSRQGVSVYLVDRSYEKSISALVIDKDSYFAIENGKSDERHYPLSIKSLLPGIIKFVQAVLNFWFSFLTRTIASEVNYSYLIDPYLVVKLLFICKRERIDIIQCEFPFPTFSSLIVKKITGVPLVYDAHNIESKRIENMANVSNLHSSIMRKIETRSCNICDLVLAVSEDDRVQLLRWGIPDKKVIVVPNSIVLEEFPLTTDGSKIRKKYALEDAFIIIFHGYMGYPPNREAAQILVELLPRIVEKHDFVHLLLVGADPPKAHHPNVITTGLVRNVQEHIAAADLAVVPLLSGGGTKLKMLEYMALGKAIVSTVKAAEGLSLENEKDVLMSKDVNSEFISLIFRAIEDVNLRKRIGANARRKIELLYDWEQNSKKVVEVYRNLVQRQRIAN